MHCCCNPPLSPRRPRHHAGHTRYQTQPHDTEQSPTVRSSTPTATLELTTPIEEQIPPERQEPNLSPPIQTIETHPLATELGRNQEPDVPSPNQSLRHYLFSINHDDNSLLFKAILASVYFCFLVYVTINYYQREFNIATGIALNAVGINPNEDWYNLIHEVTQPSESGSAVLDYFDDQCPGYPHNELNTTSVMGSYAPFLSASLSLCPDLLLNNLIDLGITTFRKEKRPHEEVKKAKKAYKLLRIQLGEPYLETMTSLKSDLIKNAIRFTTVRGNFVDDNVPIINFHEGAFKQLSNCTEKLPPFIKTLFEHAENTFEPMKETYPRLTHYALARLFTGNQDLWMQANKRAFSHYHPIIPEFDCNRDKWPPNAVDVAYFCQVQGGQVFLHLFQNPTTQYLMSGTGTASNTWPKTTHPAFSKNSSFTINFRNQSTWVNLIDNRHLKLIKRINQEDGLGMTVTQMKKIRTLMKRSFEKDKFQAENKILAMDGFRDFLSHAPYLKEAYSKEYSNISTDLTLKKLYESYFMSISLALQNNHSLKQQLPEGLSRVLYPIHGSPKGEQVNPNRSRVVWEYLNVPAKRRIELTEYMRFSFLMDAIMTCRFSRT